MFDAMVFVQLYDLKVQERYLQLGHTDILKALNSLKETQCRRRDGVNHVIRTRSQLTFNLWSCYPANGSGTPAPLAFYFTIGRVLVSYFGDAALIFTKPPQESLAFLVKLTLMRGYCS